MKLNNLFSEFFESERAGSMVLIVCTAVSLALANSAWHESYLGLWHFEIANHSVTHWINDGLMTIFFLLIGLELEREVYIGELSSLKKALLPIVAAVGGMIVPAGIHYYFNAGTITQSGAAIPMATDIAFAIGVLSLLGKRVPLSLKIFLTALAVIDDLGAIVVIATFYASGLSLFHLMISAVLFAFMLLLNRLKVYKLFPYLICGAVMWYFMLQSGVHATITGVMLAFAIPFADGSETSISYKLQHWLHKPVSLIILPLFALANTAIVVNGDWTASLFSSNTVGIFTGLVIGKPLGIVLFSLAAVLAGFSVLPGGLKWSHLAGAGFLGGIGFTMSIFITLLAFGDNAIIDASKIGILIASSASGIIGFVWLRMSLKKPSERGTGRQDAAAATDRL
ncbi:MAG TPA: Na+/H+ antiporter NhaA [Ohtaekwangia sp.]|nr:Na+/H+ antiporter NhaA [Ohtaekwangia sp.]